MPTTFDPTGANNMTAIKDRITRTLSEATRDMTPLETFANVGKAASQAATGQTTFGDALNAMNAKRIEAARQMMQVLQQDRQIGLQEKAGERAERQLGLQEEQLDLSRDQFGLQQQQQQSAEARAAQEAARADRRLGLEEENVSLRREELTHKKLQDAADRGDADAQAVVDAIQTLVPEEQRATYAAALDDLPYDVDRSNVVTAIGRIRRNLEETGGLPAEETDFDDEAKLRTEFTKLSDEFLKVRDAYDRVLASTAKPSPAGDLSLIFNFMKMLDPGSTVREREFANAANAAPLLERMGISFDKVSAVWEGKTLTDRQRQDFVNQAQGLFKSANRRQDALAEGWEGLAKRRGHNPENVVMDFAGPLRYRAMSEEELTSALEGAQSKSEVDAIVAEFDRRAGGGPAQRPFDQGALGLTPQEQRIVDYHRNSMETGNVGRGPQGEPVTVFSLGIKIPDGPHRGKFVSVPGWVNGRILSEREAYDHWREEINAGRWPMYESGSALNRRAEEIHSIMDAEAGQARAARRQ